MKLTVTIKHFSYHLIWIMTLLELLTVPLLIIFHHSAVYVGHLKTPWHGFVIGFIGTFILFFLLNMLLSRLDINIKGVNLKKFSLLAISFWSGWILLVLFYLQNLLNITVISHNKIFNDALHGFIVTTLTVLIVSGLYLIITYYMHFLRIKIFSSRIQFQLITYSIISAAILAGIYESFALPIINFWHLFPTHQQIYMGALFGALGGAIGSLAVVLVGNLVKSFISFFLIFEKKTI